MIGACSLEPFHVHCETCGARLKVRSEEVIGQIHACPKCDSMVQILPPAGWSAIAAGTSQEFAAVGNDAGGLSRIHTVADFDKLSPRKATSPSGVREVADFAMRVDDVEMTSAEVVASAEPVLPAAASGTAWWVWGLSGVALLLVGGLAGVFLSGRETESIAPAKPEPTAAAAVNDGEPEPVAENPAMEVVSEPAAGEPPAVVAETSENKLAADSAPSAPAVGESPKDEPEVVAAATPVVEEPVVKELPPLPPPTETATDDRAEVESSKEAEPSPVMKLDPLNFDAAELTLAPSTAPAPGSIPPGAAEAAESAEGEGVLAGDEPAAVEKVDHSLTVRLGAMLEGAPRPHGVAEQLSLRVNSFEVAEMPLERFVGTVSDLANLAITVDPVELELAGLSPRQPVTAKVADATVEKLLSDSLAKLRLEVDDSDGHVKLVLAGGEKRRAVEYDVADLVGSEVPPAEASSPVRGGDELVALIKQFVVPESWKAGGGVIEARGRKLRVDHSQRVRHQVLIFCERLRMARGLPVKSRYPAALLSVEPAYQSIATKLQQKTTFTFLPWSRFADVINHCEGASGLTILINWEALAEAELGPNSPMACSATNRSWQDVLDKTLEPIGLAWWPANKDTIVITSADACEDVQRVEFYSISEPNREQFAGDDALIASLQDHVSKQLGKLEKQPIMSIDEPSGRLIVLGSPLVHRALAERLGN
jgi:hypothetical protein